MNWEAIGAVGEVGGAIAVVATLLYLALQVRYLKSQNTAVTLTMLTASFNSFSTQIADSESLSDIVTRGRASYSSLNEDEKLRFMRKDDSSLGGDLLK